MIIRDFQKHLKILLTPNFWTVVERPLKNMSDHDQVNLKTAWLYGAFLKLISQLVIQTDNQLNSCENKYWHTL